MAAEEVTGTLEVCLQLLESECDANQLNVALKTMLKIFRNVQQHPEETKYRTLRQNNPNFNERVWKHSGAQQFFLAAGWTEIAEDGTVVLLDDSLLSPVIQLLEPRVGPQETTTVQNGGRGATLVTSEEERGRREAHLKERKKVEEQLRREKEEKRRIAEQIQADRAENRTKEHRTLHARQINRGANIKRFEDIGVDLNGGGG